MTANVPRIAALAKAETLVNQTVVVTFAGVQTDGPYAIRAPGSGSGTLELRGGLAAVSTQALNRCL